jgi:hypothetical protein
MSEYLESELRKALARGGPPEGFAERVIESIPRRNKERRTMWYAAIAAVLALALVFSGVEQRHRNEQRQRAQRTEQQVVFAIALAMRHFEHVNTELQKSAPTVKIEGKRGGERL